MNLPRFYPILDTAALRRRAIDPLIAARQILEAGAKILQFRHKGFFTSEDLDLLHAIAQSAREAGATFVVNDRADLAKLASATLHLGQDDLPPRAARLIVGQGTAIGFSTHNEAQLRASNNEPVDYVALGPMFGTFSKENPDPVVGLDELRRIRPITIRPLVAIGGITRANAPSVIEAGADSVAIISALIPHQAHDWLALLA